MKCMNVLCVNPFPLDVLRNTMWLILEILVVFKRKGCFESLFFMFENTFIFVSCLFACYDV